MEGTTSPVQSRVTSAPSAVAARQLPFRRRVAPAIGLVFLAPFVGEFLLGNVSIVSIIALFVLAPMYGFGALLIRESARQAGRGWPTMIVLGIAYSLFEEALVTQFLFNPSYHGLDLQSAAYVPELGIGVRLTVTIIALHTIWSTCVPIALIEALVPERSTTPWLGKVGLVVTALVFLLGSYYLFNEEVIGQGFMAAPGQLVGAAIVILLLIVLAFRLGRAPRPVTQGWLPVPWQLGATAFVVSSVLMLGLEAPGWLGVAIGVAIMAGSAFAVWQLSSREGWSAMHRLALAAGPLLTYCWVGFGQIPLDEEAGTIDLIGNAIFAAIAIVILLAAIRSVRRASE